MDASHVEVSRSGEVAVVTLCRGKVNALNEATVEQLARRFDEVERADDLMRAAADRARMLAGAAGAPFHSLKSLTRGPVAESMRRREPDSIGEFVEIWYSKATREKLEKIEIRT